MKKIILSLALVGLVATPALGLAQTTTASSSATTTPRTQWLKGWFQERKEIIKEKREALKENREQLKETLKENREQVKEEIKDIREEMKEERGRLGLGSTTASTTASSTFKNLKKEAKEKVFDARLNGANYYAKYLVNRLTKQFENLTNLVTRLEARIAEFDKNGKNTTESKARLAEAKTLITNGQTELSALPAKLATITASSTPNDNLIKNLRDGASSTVEIIRQAHAKVVDSISALKASTK